MRRPEGRAALAWRDWARRRHSTHLVLKGVVLLLGAGLVVAGIAMLVLPGPGWAAIFLGLVVLGSEFDSAARVRHALHEKVKAGWSTATSWRTRRPGSPTAEQGESEAPRELEGAGRPVTVDEDGRAEDDRPRELQDAGRTSSP